MRRHICDSIWYLYSTPSISYFQLMLAAQNTEGVNEESQDQIRARATVTTKPVETMAELKQQMTQLMVALNQTG